MAALASSFDDAWARFQTLDALHVDGDTLDDDWSRGRAQYLTFLLRIEDAAAREHLARLGERLRDIPGVELYPDWYWHVTVKGVGFQVIKRTHKDDVLREDVSRIAGTARAVLSREDAYAAQLGLVNAFPTVVFVELFDNARTRALNVALAQGVPQIAAFPSDGEGFLPHISIARFTSNDGLAALKETLAALRAEGPGPSFPIRRVEFIKAWLSEDPPDLNTLATYQLAGPPAGRSAPVSTYRAVVFDMDGVLVDSEPAFFEAVNELLAPAGKRIEWEQYEGLLGTSMSVTWRGVLDAVGMTNDDVQPYLARYGDTLIEVLRRPRDLLPGVDATIRALKQRNVPIAVATSSRQEWVEALLVESAGLPLDTFDAVVWRQLVERSKPAPDLYLKAAELLGVAPERCIAVEDTPPGIEAAKAAGMYAVQVRAASTAFPPIERADLVIQTLAEFPMGLIGK